MIKYLYEDYTTPFFCGRRGAGFPDFGYVVGGCFTVRSHHSSNLIFAHLHGWDIKFYLTSKMLYF